MELSAGTRLGPYEIVRSIGAGGMGVVYRAKDTRLDRSVAVKVLPESLRGDTDRLRRFEQEARAVGGLNHPNLVTLHDVGRHDDVPYLVTELLEGLSLRTKLADGALALREAVRIAIEIARGLAAAHGASIVHRDIKPDNVFVTGDGRVKILDFGIAKLQRDAPEDLASAPTLGGSGTAGTGTGVVIGTPGYMAPEQLTSGEVDARTDVFALGVVLFEMLTRKRPFAAETGIEESYAVVKQPPGPFPDSVPPALARVVMRCLEKRREARFQSAADLAFALESFETAPTGPTTTVEQVKPPRERKLPIVPLALIGAVTVLGTFWLLKSHRDKPVTTAIVQKPSDHWPDRVPGGPKYRQITFKTEPKWFARFSADGNGVLFSQRDGEDFKVMRTDLAQLNLVEIQGAKGRVLDVSKSGEIALRQRMPDKPGGLLATFKEGTGARERDVNIHDATYVGDQLAVIRDAGDGMTIEFPIGTPIVERRNVALEFLRASPDASKLAVAVHEIVSDTRGYVVILDLHGKQLARTEPHATIDGVAWSVDGSEVWFSDDLGIEALDAHGKERTIVRAPTDMFLRDVRHDDTNRILAAQRNLHVHAFARRGSTDVDIGWRSAMVAAISRDGTTVALLEGTGVGENEDGYQLYVRKGQEQPVPIEHGFDIELVADGSVAVLLVAKNKPLRVVPTRAGTPRELPLGPIEQLDYSAKLEITPDGKNVIVLAAAKGQQMRFWQIALDGKTAPVPIGPDHIVRIGEDAHQRFHFAASPDGKWIAVPATKGVQLVATSGIGEQAIPGAHSESPLAFSDDGRAVFVWRAHGWPRPLERVELAAPYRRTEMFPFETPEEPHAMDVAVDGAGATIAYSWIEVSSDLFVLEPP